MPDSSPNVNTYITLIHLSKLRNQHRYITTSEIPDFIWVSLVYPPMFFFCSNLQSGSPPCILSPCLLGLLCSVTVSYSLNFTTLIILRSTEVRYFEDCPSVWVSFFFFLRIILGFWVVGKKGKDPSLHTRSECVGGRGKWPITGDVNMGRRCLPGPYSHCFFPFHALFFGTESLNLTHTNSRAGGDWAPPPGGNSIYIYCLEFFCNEDLSLPPCLFIVYLFICLFGATPTAYVDSQTKIRGLTGATAAGLCHSHTRATAMPDPSPVFDLHHSSQQHRILTPWARPGMDLQPYGSQSDLFPLRTRRETPVYLYTSILWIQNNKFSRLRGWVST